MVAALCQIVSFSLVQGRRGGLAPSSIFQTALVCRFQNVKGQTVS